MTAKSHPALVAIIAERIKDLRQFRQMSLQDVADAAGLSKPHVWNLEKGISDNPGVQTVAAIADALGTSLAYMLGLDPNNTVLDPFAFKIARLIDERYSLPRPSRSPGNGMPNAAVATDAGGPPLSPASTGHSA